MLGQAEPASCPPFAVSPRHAARQTSSQCLPSSPCQIWDPLASYLDSNWHQHMQRGRDLPEKERPHPLCGCASMMDGQQGTLRLHCRYQLPRVPGVAQVHAGHGACWTACIRQCSQCCLVEHQLLGNCSPPQSALAGHRQCCTSMPALSMQMSFEFQRTRYCDLTPARGCHGYCKVR